MLVEKKVTTPTKKHIYIYIYIYSQIYPNIYKIIQEILVDFGIYVWVFVRHGFSTYAFLCPIGSQSSLQLSCFVSAARGCTASAPLPSDQYDQPSHRQARQTQATN